jgi:amicyanin
VSPRRFSIPIGVVAAALAAVAVAAACFSERAVNLTALPTDCQDIAKSLSIPAANVVVGIKDFAFVPANVEVAAGKTVTWVNCEAAGTAGHTVTSDAGSTELSSPLMTRGQTYSHTFTKAGTFAYHCSPHPFMKATAVVR